MEKDKKRTAVVVACEIDLMASASMTDGSAMARISWMKTRRVQVSRNIIVRISNLDRVASHDPVAVA